MNMKKLAALLMLLTLLMTLAVAEDEVIEEDILFHALPISLDAGPAVNAANYTETGYTDDSITVTVTTEWRTLGKKNTCFDIARVSITDASQLRTALSAKKVTQSMKLKTIKAMAETNNAVIAIGGDYCGDRTTGFIVRGGEVIRTKLGKSLDILVIDSEGTFHIVTGSDEKALKALLDSGITVMHAFTFGPALVIDGQVQEVKKYSSFNPTGAEPRCAIGQVGPLEYVLVIAEGRSPTDSDGCTLPELAEIMAELGCQQAFNLDGGNSALMVVGGKTYPNKKQLREVSDIIYFATLQAGE